MLKRQSSTTNMMEGMYQSRSVKFEEENPQSMRRCRSSANTRDVRKASGGSSGGSKDNLDVLLHTLKRKNKMKMVRGGMQNANWNLGQADDCCVQLKTK
jgi:hypothetical protein